MLKKRIIAPIIGFIVFTGLWELADIIFNIKETILPRPAEILTALTNHFGSIMYHTGITMIESIAGFFIGAIIGISIAILFVYNKTAKDTLYPYAIALKITPLIAVAPLLVIWFGNGMLTKMMGAALIVFFPILVNTVKGLSSPQKEHEELLKSFKANKRQMFFKLHIPSALPYMFPALKIGTSFAIVGTIIVEFMGSSAGIGHMILRSSYYLDTSLIFASLVAIILAGIIFFYAVDYAEKKIVFWQEEREL